MLSMACFGAEVPRLNMTLGQVSLTHDLALTIALNPGAAQTWNWDEVNKYIKKVRLETVLADNSRKTSLSRTRRRRPSLAWSWMPQHMALADQYRLGMSLAVKQADL